MITKNVQNKKKNRRKNTQISTKLKDGSGDMSEHPPLTVHTWRVLFVVVGKTEISADN